MDYPKSMYKGEYTPEMIFGEHKIAWNEKEEKTLRKAGFVSGHEFFTKHAEN